MILLRRIQRLILMLLRRVYLGTLTRRAPEAVRTEQILQHFQPAGRQALLYTLRSDHRVITLCY